MSKHSSSRPGGVRKGSITRTSPPCDCEMLERRTLLSTISWVNKGTGAGAGDTDSFNAIYGASATAARNIVQRAIDDWERVIVDFNGFGGRNDYDLTIDAAAISGRGSTGSVSYDLLSKPQSATITMDDNGGGTGWYFDTVVGSATVPDDGEFTLGSTPFQGDSSLVDFDFYRTIAHEIGHAMGLSSSSTLRAVVGPGRLVAVVLHRRDASRWRP